MMKKILKYLFLFFCTSVLWFTLSAVFGVQSWITSLTATLAGYFMFPIMNDIPILKPVSSKHKDHSHE